MKRSFREWVFDTFQDGQGLVFFACFGVLPGVVMVLMLVSVKQRDHTWELGKLRQQIEQLSSRVDSGKSAKPKSK